MSGLLRLKCLSSFPVLQRGLSGGAGCCEPAPHLPPPRLLHTGRALFGPQVCPPPHHSAPVSASPLCMCDACYPARIELCLCSRNENGTPAADLFQSTLTAALCNLIPLLPFASSAPCVHWLLRMVAVLTKSCDVHVICSLCLKLLVGLTEEMASRDSPSTHLIQSQ